MKELIRLRYLSSMFSKSCLKGLVKDGPEGILQIQTMALKAGLTSKITHLKIGEIYDLAYKELVTSYRSEYVYKNAIAEKIIKGRHRLSNNCHFDTEFRVYDSIADVIIANGTTTAYEIKTEYDSFDRLHNQLSDYSKVFEHVYVVIPESKYLAWLNNIPHFAGVMTLTKGYSLKIKRNPLSNVSNIDLSVVFSCLRRNEILCFIENYFGYLPDVKPVALKGACKELFLTLSKEQAHKALLSALKTRGLQKNGVNLVKGGPSSLVSLFLTANLSRKQAGSLVEVL